jgi:hypothetical protein
MDLWHANGDLTLRITLYFHLTAFRANFPLTEPLCTV